MMNKEQHLLVNMFFGWLSNLGVSKLNSELFNSVYFNSICGHFLALTC